MKNYLVLLAVLGMRLVVAAQVSTGFTLQGIGSAVIPVTTRKMTNLIFPAELQSAVKVSRDILAQRVKGVTNVIELKAVRADFPETNLTVYGKDGRVYSFVVHFSADSNVLNFRVLPVGGGGDTGALAGSAPLTGLPTGASIGLVGLPSNVVQLSATAQRLCGLPAFLHVGARSERVRVRLSGIYLTDGLEWLVLRVADGSRIPFEPSYVRYYLADRRQVKRRAMQEEALAPVFSNMPGRIEGEGESAFAVGFTPFTVPRGKMLVVQLAGADGGRTVVLSIRSKMVLRAR